MYKKHMMNKILDALFSFLSECDDDLRLTIGKGIANFKGFCIFFVASSGSHLGAYGIVSFVIVSLVGSRYCPP